MERDEGHHHFSTGFIGMPELPTKTVNWNANVKSTVSSQHISSQHAIPTNWFVHLLFKAKPTDG